MAKLSLESELCFADGAWTIRDAGRTLAAFGWDALRVSLSWKALVFPSDADRCRYEDHSEDIDLAEVLRRFTGDLAERGIRVEWPADPVRDPATIRLLTDAYVRYPAANRAA
jgi:hypothetical protein